MEEEKCSQIWIKANVREHRRKKRLFGERLIPREEEDPDRISNKDHSDRRGKQNRALIVTAVLNEVV